MLALGVNAFCDNYYSFLGVCKNYFKDIWNHKN